MTDSAERYRRQERLFDFRESTDVVLMVDALGQGESCEWDPTRIRDALIIEAGVEPSTAEEISMEIEDDLLSHGRQRVNTAIIRELVNVKLFQRGLDAKLTDHRRIGIPLHDLEQMLFCKNRENSASGYTPESVNHTVAETVIKEYALSKIFTQEVAEAHLKGDIHLHDLGMANRPYSSLQSAAYVARNGLRFPGAVCSAAPAKHADVLLAHLVTMTTLLQNSFAGALAWDAVNVIFAPYLDGLSDAEIRQLAQTMLFEFDRLASGRGTAAFTSLDLYFDVPKHLADAPATGAGGQYTGKNYSEYAEGARKFLRALLEIYKEGCGEGQPFFFPKALLHVTKETLETQDKELLLLACEAAAEKGSVQFVFDKDFVTLGECYRLDESGELPAKLRRCVMQNVTLNLPRAAYKADGSTDSLLEILSGELELAAKAHIQKRDFIKKLLAYGVEGPLGALVYSNDDAPYFRLEKTEYLIGLLGLNEMVLCLTGKELHETPEAAQLGLEIVRTLAKKCAELSEKYNMNFMLEQTPAESTALRFARLDLKQYPQKAEKTVRGDAAKGAVYYTNSTQLAVSADVSAFNKIDAESRMHPHFAGAVTVLCTGGARGSAETVLQLVRHAFEAGCSQLALSPSFTICGECGSVSRGLNEYCLACESESVDGIAKIAGHYSYVSSWNAGKLAELKDRKQYREFN